MESNLHLLLAKRLPAAVGIAALILFQSGPVLAGGYDTGERDWDFLFQDKPFAFETSVRTIHPQRSIGNVTGVLGPSIGAKEAESFTLPRFSAAVRLGENARCMASYREPWGGHANYGAAWTYSFSAIEQHFTSSDYGLTCGAGFQAGKGRLSFLGGFSYQEIGYVLTQNGGIGGLRTTDVDDGGYGWRAGIAYEIPEYALRASLIYNAQTDYDMTGTVALANVPGAIPVFGSISMPQSLEAKFQSGVAPGWLAFGALKWTDWSVAANMPLCAVGTPVCTQPFAVSGLTLLWKDSWTLTLGAARQINERFSVAASLTWDQGATQGFTSQTDTWVAGVTAIMAPNEYFEMRLGGTAGVMTGGTANTMVLADGSPNPVGYTASFGNDLVYSASASIVAKF